MKLSISHAIQQWLLWNDLAISKLMKVVLISALVIFGMLFVKEAVPDGENWTSLHPLKMEQSDGWTCILRNGDSGQHCYSEAMMQQIEAWRDSIRYLPKGE